MTRQTLIWLTVGIACLAGTSRHVAAHKPVTSKYTFNQDVFPIFRDKCATCHRPGGAGPMSLMTYQEAFPWAESIRAELIAGRMPPAAADPTFGAIQHNRTLTAHETDIILTWATGGNPQGAGAAPADPAPDDRWTLGPPDAVLKLPEATLAADQSEDTREFTVKMPPNQQWIRAIDLRPGNAAIVRNAFVFAKGAGQSAESLSPEQVICRWIPGQAPVDVGKEGAGFLVPAGTELVTRVHYKKTYTYDGKPATDSSSLGLYFSKNVPKKIAAFSLDSPEPITPGASSSYTIDVPQSLDAVGLRIDSVPPNVSIEVEVPAGSGAPVPLVRFAARPNWERRFWFAHPIALASGNKVQVRVAYRDPALVADAFGGVNTLAPAPLPAPVRMTLDVAPH